MSKPDKKLGEAKVLYWAWSDSEPFGYFGDIKIYGLAICQYENSNEVYRFSCDESWEVQGDQIYDSVEEAIEQLPDQYREIPAKWMKFED